MSANPKRLLRSAAARAEAAHLAWFQRRLRRRGNSVGSGCLVPPGSRIGTRIEVGDETKIAGPIVIMGGGPVSFGRYCLLGRGVRIFSSNHRLDTPAVQDYLQPGPPLAELSKPVRIGNGVWIGDAAIVLAGVEIGNGAVVGAGAVVSRDVAPFAIVVGSPAREVRKRFDPAVIVELEELAWWEWPLERVRANPGLFGADLTRSRVRDHCPLPVERR